MPDANIQGRLHVPTRRNIMREFTLSEISAVDRPAQEAAKMAIMKRDQRTDEDIAKALVDAHPIQTKGDLTKILVITGGSPPPLFKEHIIRRAQTLGATDQLPDGWLIKSDEGADEMNVAELEKKVGELTAELAKQKTDAEATAATVTKAAGDLKAAQDLLAKANEENVVLKAVAGLTATEKAWYDEMKDKEGDKEGDKAKKADARKSFLAATPEERSKTITAKAATDEVIKIEGQEVRKSVVGDAQFEIMKSQATRLANLEKANVEEISKREEAEFTKAAADNYSHLPGTDVEKGAVLRAISKLDEKVRETVGKMLKAGEGAVVAAFDKVGHSGGKPAVDGGKFDSRVSEIRKRDGISRTDALEKARKEFPEEFKAYQGQN